MTRRLVWLAPALACIPLACTPRKPPETPGATTAGLGIGSEAMIVSGSGSAGILMETEKGKGSIGGDMESVDAGTMARVVSILEGPDEDRDVRVMLLDGKHPGLPGTVKRSELRPLP